MMVSSFVILILRGSLLFCDAYEFLKSQLCSDEAAGNKMGIWV